MPCDQCTDPARCENFGVCQIFKHTLPAGSYEQRIKEVSPENQYIGDLMILQVLADSDCVNDQEREVLLRWIELSQPPGADAPCKPGTRCSRSIRGLGGCEAGSCEREEGAGGVMVPHECKRHADCIGRCMVCGEDVPAGVPPSAAPSMVGVGTDEIERPMATHGASHLYGVDLPVGGGDGR